MEMTIRLDGHSIRILDGPYIRGTLATPAAYEFATHLLSLVPAMKKYAANELMDAYDNLWPEDEYEPLTKSEFGANLTSPQIIIRDKVGAASVYFDDAGMFRDHSLSVAITNGRIADVSLE